MAELLNILKVKSLQKKQKLSRKGAETQRKRIEKPSNSTKFRNQQSNT
jgi:hypothetical protein